MSEIDDEELTEIVREALDAMRSVGGDVSPESTGLSNRNFYTPLTREFEVELYKDMLRSGVLRNDPNIVDAFGKFDKDYYNTGPEMSSEWHPALNCYNSILNEEELATKRGKARKRILATLPLDPTNNGELWSQREALSRSSSVSSVSVVSIAGEPGSDYQLCSSNCWLRHTVSETPPVSIKARADVRLSLENPTVYQSIKQAHTRIVCIAPGSFDEAITCTIEPLALPRAHSNSSKDKTVERSYEALSYTWGDQYLRYSITCNGVPFSVGENLFNALHHLRLSDKPRWIWADAICINQEDIAERNEQVSYMLDIYKGASAVVVWLGIGADESSFAIEGMKFLDDWDNRRAIFRTTHTPQCMAKLHRLYKAQFAIFKRSWFRRSWIRQEIVAAKEVTVMCGQSRVSWYILKRSANRLERIHGKLKLDSNLELENFDSSFINPLSYLVQGWVFGQPIISPGGELRSIWYYHAGGFLDLLMVGREFDATDPRDKIYSVLGMARVPIEGTNTENRRPLNITAGEEDIETMKVDYSKSLSEVYQYVTKFFINRDRNLDILCILLTHRDSNSHDLPSWTPDWRASTKEARLKECWEYFNSKFGAAGFTKTSKQDQDNIGRLVVEGFTIDVVESLVNYTSHVPIGPGHQLAQLIGFDKKRHLRRLGRTRSGVLCLVPRDTRVGDRIYVLHGGKLLFVLRAFLLRVDSKASREEGKAKDISKDKPTITQAGLEMLASKPKIQKDGDYEKVCKVIGPCWMPGVMYGATIKRFEERPEYILKRIVLI